jgi:hypothetical protein
METYEFYIEAQDGTYTRETGLTKRQAVIRYNKATTRPDLKATGWCLETDTLADQIRAKKAYETA